MNSYTLVFLFILSKALKGKGSKKSNPIQPPNVLCRLFISNRHATIKGRVHTINYEIIDDITLVQEITSKTIIVRAKMH